MLPVYSSAVSGLQASQAAMDTISNNVANADTPGFDASDPTLADLTYQNFDPRLLVSSTATQMALGAGARFDIAPRSLQPGAPMDTGNPLDVTITGDGYLQVRQTDGTTGYTRLGALRPDATGRLTIGGLLVQPPITLPPGAEHVTIGAAGQIAATVNGQPQTVGTLQFARFINPQGLLATTNTIYAATGDSGPPIVGAPATTGFGGVQSGTLEAARVDLGRQMSILILAERAYGLDARALQAIDRMVGDVTKG